jgi:hypothetical protein
MKIAVIGGTGMIGSRVVDLLADGSNEVRILSRNAPSGLSPGAEHRAINLRSLEGLEQAISGVETVVDLANDVRSAHKVMVDATRSVLEICKTSGVGHYAGISIIGCEKLSFSYYKAKATQFHEFIGLMLGTAARFRLSPRGPVRLQPVSASVAARTLTEMVDPGADRMVTRLAGPRIEDLGALSKAWREHQSKRLIPLRLPLIGCSGRALRSGALTDQDAATPAPGFEDWLASEHA